MMNGGRVAVALAASFTFAVPNPTGALEQLQTFQQKAELRLEQSAQIMGTTFTVILYGSDRAQRWTALYAAFDEARRLDRMLSNYQADSQLSQVNRHAAERPVKVTPELFTLLRECDRYSRESEGTFDITVGPLMKVWGFYRGKGGIVAKTELALALEQVGYWNVILDADHGTVRFAKAGVGLDLGGIGKGYAVDRMVAVLKEHGITTALVNAGRSSIYGLGAPPSELRGWEVDIRDPNNHSEAAAKVYLKNQSISTSGSTEKFFQAEGRIYSHIMNPRTGYPAEGMLEVSVIAPRTVDSEAWTKPYFILGRKWAARHKPDSFRVFLCDDNLERRCSWV